MAMLSLAIIATVLERAHAGGGGCAHCGCNAPCQKTCRLVCEEKKVEIVCWGCKCEDFCLGGPSKKGCMHSDVVCESCKDEFNPNAVQTQPKKFVWNEWIPCSSKIYTKKKLMKKIETKKIPSYKWVVEDLCEKCEANCEVADIQPGAEIPAPPVSDTKLLYGRNLAVVPQVKTSE